MTIEQEVIDAGVAAVEAAARLTRAAQGRLVEGGTLTKSDDSPVTVADFGAQAVACAVLSEALGSVVVVGEEHPADLADRPEFAGAVSSLVADALDREVSLEQLTAWLAIGAADPQGDAYWTLDPIDGTKGFLRGDQYAIALGLIEHGSVVFGVLGCPNYPVGDDERGLVLVAGNSVTTELSGRGARRVRASSIASLSHARLCESVESGHSDQSASAAIARRLGIDSEPFRIDSQCKYAAVARGDAEIYLRLPTRADYREKIWDHAAGMAAVVEAGGRVTDVTGAPLDFSLGVRLEANSGVIATNGDHHDDVVRVVAEVLGE